jgi:hypothetical protein
MWSAARGHFDSDMRSQPLLDLRRKKPAKRAQEGPSLVPGKLFELML